SEPWGTQGAPKAPRSIQVRRGRVKAVRRRHVVIGVIDRRLTGEGLRGPPPPSTHPSSANAARLCCVIRSHRGVHVLTARRTESNNLLLRTLGSCQSGQLDLTVNQAA